LNGWCRLLNLSHINLIKFLICATPAYGQSTSWTNRKRDVYAI
jgi:hypothetical protein